MSVYYDIDAILTDAQVSNVYPRDLACPANLAIKLFTPLTCSVS